MKFAVAHSSPQYDLADILRHQIQTLLNAPLTSSMGRLFDTAASLLGLRQVINYEAQAAIELETIADISIEDAYPFDIYPSGNKPSYPDSEMDLDLILDPAPLLGGIINDLTRNVPIEIIAARFQNSIAEMVSETVMTIRNATSISEIALSGGVWQNVKLLSKTLQLLEKEHFQVLVHSKVPCNDGGIALGQAALASYQVIS
jgi:hydrogenase maturation protein HypF